MTPCRGGGSPPPPLFSVTSYSAVAITLPLSLLARRQAGRDLGRAFRSPALYVPCCADRHRHRVGPPSYARPAASSRSAHVPSYVLRPESQDHLSSRAKEAVLF